MDDVALGRTETLIEPGVVMVEDRPSDEHIVFSFVNSTARAFRVTISLVACENASVEGGADSLGELVVGPSRTITAATLTRVDPAQPCDVRVSARAREETDSSIVPIAHSREAALGEAYDPGAKRPLSPLRLRRRLELKAIITPLVLVPFALFVLLFSALGFGREVLRFASTYSHIARLLLGAASGLLLFMYGVPRVRLLESPMRISLALSQVPAGLLVLAERANARDDALGDCARVRARRARAL